MNPSTQRKGIIAWFAHNPVAANLLMIIILIVGMGAAFNIQRTIFPAIEIEFIHIAIPYPGAAPEEVEKGIVAKVEEAINDLDGIKRIESSAMESIASIWVEPQDGTDVRKLQGDIKNRIDAIQHFPEQAEKAVIGQPEIRFPVLSFQLSGDLDERGMKMLAQEMRQELMAYPEVSAVEIQGDRNNEIAVEISEQLLREYHLTLDQVAKVIASSSLDLPAGSVQTASGDIMLRTIGQAYVQQDFESLVLKTWPDGTRLLLGDIATIDDGFVDAKGFALFNGVYSLGLDVYATGKQDIIETAKVAKAWAAEKRTTLPAAVKLDMWSDMTYYLNGRLGMMVKNLAVGALLVFVVLALFLEIKLAFWVMLGIPVCFLGAMALIVTPYVDASLNMISIFGFILVLGIVVDDAIIMGESAYTEQELHGHSIDSVIDGVYKVATPATFGVLTTIVAFAPTLFVQGIFSVMPEAVGWVVILCLVFSLIESKWILPAHLAHSKPTKNRFLLQIDHVQERINTRLKHFIEHRYSPLMERCLANRYTTLAFFLSLLILCGGLVAGGIVKTVLHPDTPGEFLKMELRMSEGTHEDRTRQVTLQVMAALKEVETDHWRDTGSTDPLIDNVATYGFDRINSMAVVELMKEEQRSLTTREIERRWREKVQNIHGTQVLAISNIDGPGFGPALSFDLKHNDFAVLSAAAQDLTDALRQYHGVYDIRNGAGESSSEFHLDILAEAQSLGLTRYDLGSQVRHAFYGAEAQRIQRGEDEIKVMVRYPKADRENVDSLSNMYIRTPNGSEVPFESVAKLEVKEGLLKSTRVNFQRAVEVTANADKTIVEPQRIEDDIVKLVMPELLEKYPGLSYNLGGMSDEMSKMIRSMTIGFSLALFGIYALLAIPTKSYLQPLIIMGVIPFGVIGAVVGHWLLGLSMSMMSLFGVIALSGVVVNDSLILVDFINKTTAAGTPLYRAVVEAGQRRFRAIMLTSLTTFCGLAPMLTERSSQAMEVIPMAVSLAFGIVFATVITLLLVPCLYLILADMDRWWNGSTEEEIDENAGQVST
jgi:multidrug efflux pump subunit AcrB